jgi:hypothetical protein
MSDSFDDNGFSLKPKTINDDAWFYENKKGLTIAVQMQGTLQSIVGTVNIPWTKLKPAIDRYQKFERAKARKKRAAAKR